MAKSNEASLIQLYIAEYQALTTRASYWIVLQVSLLPVVPIYLALAAQMWQSGVIVKEVVVWVTLAGLQLIGIVWSQTMLEQYAVVKYLEFYLRPLVKDIVKSNVFWGYEPYLVKHRMTAQSWGEASMSFLGIIIFAITLATRFREFSGWDTGGVIVNLMLLFVLCRQSFKAKKVRLEWSTSDMQLAQMLEEVRRTEMESTE